MPPSDPGDDPRARETAHHVGRGTGQWQSESCVFSCTPGFQEGGLAARGEKQHAASKSTQFWYKPYLHKDSLDLSTVLASLLFYYRVEDVLCRNPCIGHTPVVAEHPEQDIREGALGLERGTRGTSQQRTAHILSSLHRHSESFVSSRGGLLAAWRSGDPEANEGPDTGHVLLRVSALQYGSAGFSEGSLIRLVFRYEHQQDAPCHAGKREPLGDWRSGISPHTFDRSPRADPGEGTALALRVESKTCNKANAQMEEITSDEL